MYRRAATAAAVGAALVALPTAAHAQDTTPPVMAPATFATPASGNGNWRLTAPQTLNLSATDDVAVTKFQYSLDGGATYVDVPATAGAASLTLSQEGNTPLRYRAVDEAGNVSRATVNTTLNQAAAAGASAVRLQSTAGLAPGDRLQLNTGATQETATIATIVAPAPPAPQPNVTLTAPLANAHPATTAVAGTAFAHTIALQIDTKAPVATWGTQASTLAAPAAAGATGIRIASVSGRTAGETLQVDQGGNAETVKVASVDPTAAAPAPNVVLTSALTKAHISGANVYVPQVVDGKILQSQTLTPLRSDPRLRDSSDTVASGAGGAAPRRMTLDGEFMVPKTVNLNRLTVGKHTQTVSLQDAAGQTAKYVNTFVVTTSFADLATVIDQHADNALRTTLNGAQAVGATGLRLTAPVGGFRAGQQLVVGTGDGAETVTIAKALTPPPTLNTTLSAAATAGATQIRLASYTTETLTGPNPPSNNGPIIGQPIVLDTGANQEVVYVKRHLSPLPPAPAPNVELSAPLAKDHAAGTATSLNNVTLTTPLTKAHATGTTVANPQPLISAAKATELRALLADAKAKADAGQTAAAITALQAFNAAAAASRPLQSAGEALIAQLNGTPVDTTGTGITVEAAEDGVQAIRVFNNPSPFVNNPMATYKILVNGRAGGFRHQSIVDFHWMFQQLGFEHGFNVDIWDPNINGSPGRQAPAGVSLPTSPFLDYEQLKQYKTIIFNSTVGLNATSTVNAVEFANLQRFVREGGGVIAIHGGTDAMQNVPWYMDLVGAGFTNHGSNQGGILIDTESGGHVELINADPAHSTMQAVPRRFFSIEELYNTNRDPAALGIAHPLMYENEDTLVGQLGYGPGNGLHNTDKHVMTWCRNFDGGRSFTTTLGHNWQYATETWFRDMMLNAVQWTAGQEYSNCVTFNEVRDLLAKARADGNVTAAGNTALSAALEEADTAYRADDFAGAATHARTFVAEAKRAVHAGADNGAALLALQTKGAELVGWMSGNEAQPAAPVLQTDATGTVGGTVPATLALSLAGAATFQPFVPGVEQEYTTSVGAKVISSAGEATLSVSDPGHMTNGAFALAEPLRVSFSKSSWTAPTANENVDITFKQLIKRTDPLRTGSYRKTLTFTLSTTTP
ncbi:ThuA domain-containing protein [Solirubrobacter sp. CPCC 204708]|uniref:ThuA domain-containing protein n=1 Tax=Solirubrobacter deserti TaxID=2282478 RepID=A0ABT4RC94_9ACTN|nr:ThuA domain-containing protein [Solirubrobacter deserti]MBE2315512.1 ThuA domain-containing protein [Solirubrobacter deserti]MDA0136151.1 ThuA domain-containing protein [Solirubrobacter deserti]